MGKSSEQEQLMGEGAHCTSHDSSLRRWLNARGRKIKVQGEWDTFPWTTRSIEALCVTQLHVILVVACLPLLPLKYCSHYPTLHPGWGSLWTSDYQKPQEYSQEVSLQHLLLSPHQQLALVRAKQRSLVPLIPAVSVFCILEQCYKLLTQFR